MAEKSDLRPEGAAPVAGALVSPPTFSANSVSISMNVSELVLTFGQSRAIFDAVEPAQAKGLAIEWTASFSVGAAAAVQMHDALGKALQEYQKRFGAIPKDANAKMQILDK